MYLSKIDFLSDIYDQFFSFVFIVACSPWLINNHVFLAINEKSSISDNTISLHSKNVKTNKLSKSLKCLYQYLPKITASIIVTQPSSVMQSMLWLFGCLVLSYLSQVEPIFQVIIMNAYPQRNNFAHSSTIVITLILPLQAVNLIWILNQKPLSQPLQAICNYYNSRKMTQVSQILPYLKIKPRYTFLQLN